MSKTITIRLDDDLARTLDQVAESAHRSRSGVIRSALRQRLDPEFRDEPDEIFHDRYPDLTAGEADFVVSGPKENPIKDKSFDFALQIIRLFQQLQDQREYILSKQVIRSGTSIGANVEEATAAESRADFIHKMKIAMKEARETHYWLRLLDKSNLVNGIELSELLAKADEISRMLTSITKTSVENSRKMKR